VTLEPVPEAELRETDGGLAPVTEGWFVVNVADARATESQRFGSSARFEHPPEIEFPELAINVRLLQPGQPSSLYHREGVQEAFVVLSGECLLIIEDEERPLSKGDFVHMPAGTAHVLVGAGDGPSSVLMVGPRKHPEQAIHYPRNERAARYGASAERDTPDPREAYGENPLRPAELGLPW
jgi:uncharacterized cupin superfamily protein